MTPLLTRLDEELSNCADPINRAELLAERACYLARIGQFTEANAIANSLRRDFGDGKSASVSIWLMLVEGLVLYFEEPDPAAHDRLRRAQILSDAFRLKRLGGLTAAWLAHVEFERANFAAMTQLLLSAGAASTNCPDVCCRVGMVMADGYLLNGNRALSNRWFNTVHRLAVKIGDHASIGAIIYNRAVFGVACAVAESYLKGGAVAQGVVQSLHAELSSATNFQSLSCTHSLPHLFDVCRAQLCILKKSWYEALDLTTRLGACSAKNDRRANRPNIAADVGLCLAKIGRPKEALVQILSLNVEVAARLDADDRFVLFSRVVEVLDIICPDSDLKINYESYRETARDDYLRESQLLRTALQQAEAGLRVVCDSVK